MKKTALPLRKGNDKRGTVTQPAFIREIPQVPERRIYCTTKRVFDIFFSLIGLVILALPMVAIALLIRMDSVGNPFFLQERLGKNGKPFVMCKFRTMHIGAERNGPTWAAPRDARCTRFGVFLRRARLDELPQLWNILKGDMSFVGPRPEREHFYRLFEGNVPGFSDRLAVVPGLTGHAQVNGGYDLTPAEKLAYDMEYIEKRCMKMDMLCVVKTIRVVCSGAGAR